MRAGERKIGGQQTHGWFMGGWVDYLFRRAGVF